MHATGGKAAPGREALSIFQGKASRHRVEPTFRTPEYNFLDNPGKTARVLRNDKQSETVLYQK